MSNRRQANSLWFVCLKILVQQTLKPFQDSLVNIITGDKLAVVKPNAIVQKQFNIRYNKPFTVVINGTEIVNLSKTKWQWMADKNVDKLASLFHDQSKFVHMSGTWKKTEELDIIKTGSIWYKKANVHDVAVDFVVTLIRPV